MTELNVTITIRLSEELEEKVEQIIDLLTTATYQWNEVDGDEKSDDDI